MMGAGFSDRAAGTRSFDARDGAAASAVSWNGWGSLRSICWGLRMAGRVSMMAAAECLKRKYRTEVRRLMLVAPVNPYSAHGRWLAPFFGSPQGAALVPPDRLTRMSFLYLLLARPNVWRPQAIPPGTLRRIRGSAGEAGIVRACAEHREDVDARLAGVGSDAAEAWGAFRRFYVGRTKIRRCSRRRLRRWRSTSGIPS
jgi:hypothetical protein